MDARPAQAIWVGLIVAALVADIGLARRGLPLLTHVARTPAGRAGRLLLEAHFAGVLPGYLDPFAVVGRFAR